MTRDEIAARLKKILVADFRIPEAKVTPEATFRGDLGLDSLDAVDLIHLVSKEFGLKPQIDAFRDLDTVDRVVTHVFETRSRSA